MKVIIVKDRDNNISDIVQLLNRYLIELCNHKVKKFQFKEIDYNAYIIFNFDDCEHINCAIGNVREILYDNNMNIYFVEYVELIVIPGRSRKSKK